MSEQSDITRCRRARMATGKSAFVEKVSVKENGVGAEKEYVGGADEETVPKGVGGREARVSNISSSLPMRVVQWMG
jgi:hypothetical protein